MSKITITTEALASSAVKYRKELLMMPLIALQNTIQHMSVRPGIVSSEKVGELSGEAEFGPYSESRTDNTGFKITPRELNVYLGSVVKKFSPNSVATLMYGSAFTKGDALKEADIARQCVGYMAKKVSKSLNYAIWNAKRNASGDKSVDLFDGFDTIIAKDITDAGISAAKNNFVQLAEDINRQNAVDQMKAIYFGASDELQGEPVKMFITREQYIHYCEDYKATTGAIPYNTEFKKTYLEGSDNLCELVSLPSMKGSEFIKITPQSNMLIGVNQMNDSETVAVEKHAPFVLDFIMTLFFGAQFESISPERLFIAKLKPTA